MDAVRARGWLVEDESPNFDRAADAVAAMRDLEQDDLLALLPAYAEAAERIAGREVDLVIARGEPARMVEGVVTGTILGEVLLTSLRRLAQQAASAKRFGITGPPPPPQPHRPRRPPPNLPIMKLTS
jgi:hypothetical protein